jgi:hypothetical protein
MAKPKSETGRLRPRAKRSFYRNGQLREEFYCLGQILHGRYRTWHRNGRLATESFYEHGRLHGVCRQWNQRGKLLGSFQMNHGTGIQRDWFENGQLQFETSTVDAKFTGRTRSWLQDGTLVSEQYSIKNRNVSPAEYAAAAAKHPDYPRYRDTKRKLKFPKAEEVEQREFQLQIKALLSQRNKREAKAWQEGGAKLRSLGLFNFAAAKQLVQKLYNAGAAQVLAVHIYNGKADKQFSDALLVRLPLEQKSRRLIRQTLTKLPKKQRAGVLPPQDCGEEFLFASLV